MSRIHLFATAAFLSLALGSSAMAATTVDHTPSFALAAESGAMPTVNVHASQQYMDYTGVAPSANADRVAVWMPSDAHDYTGVAPAPTAAQLALAPLWNAALVHEFMAQ